MPLTGREIESEYHAALSDAEFEPTQIRLYLADQMGTNELGAAWHRPGLELVVDEQFPDKSQLADANAPKNRDLHRIVAPARPSDVVMFAALIRHELEHARQYERLGVEFLELQQFLEDDILPRRAGGLTCCAGGLINGIPTEIDCNAASSVYVEQRFASEQIQRLRETPRRQLVCSLIGPEPLETLPGRMVSFAFIHRRCVTEVAAERGESAEELLDRQWRGAGSLWCQLERTLVPDYGK